MYGLSVSGCSGGGHEAFMLALVRFLQPRVYVELGVASGACFGPIYDEQFGAGRVALGCDWSLAAMRHPAVRLAIRSVDYVRECLVDGVVELAFVDADHRPEAVLADVMALRPKMATNGIIALHDTYPPGPAFEADERCSTAWRAVDELKRGGMGGYEVLTLATEWGLTLIRFHPGRHLAWQAEGVR